MNESNTYSKIGFENNGKGPVAMVEIGYETGQELMAVVVLWRDEHGVVQLRLLEGTTTHASDEERTKSVIATLYEIGRQASFNIVTMALGLFRPVRAMKLKTDEATPVMMVPTNEGEIGGKN